MLMLESLPDADEEETPQEPGHVDVFVVLIVFVVFRDMIVWK